MRPCDVMALTLGQFLMLKATYEDSIRTDSDG